MNQNKPSVTISLLTYNGSQYLPWLLKGVKEQTYDNYELLVLDNHSDDNSIDLVRENFPQARVVSQKKNLGFARGHNLIFNWSDSDYILVMNQDILMEPDYIEKCVDFLEKNKSVASVAGKLLYWDFAEGLKSKTIDSYGLKIDRRRHVIDNHQGQKDFDIPNTEVFGLSGALVLYRRQALDMAAYPNQDNHFEYFDESFFAYKEDVDLAWRLRILGWDHWLITNTQAYHHRSVSSGKVLKESRKHRGLANKLSYRNHLMMIFKNSYCKNFFKDIFHIKWYELKKFVYLLLFERSTLVGFKEFLTSILALYKKRRFTFKNKQVSADDIYKWFR